jgi:hypothetical protein
MGESITKMELFTENMRNKPVFKQMKSGAGTSALAQ